MTTTSHFHVTLNGHRSSRVFATVVEAVDYKNVLPVAVAETAEVVACGNSLISKDFCDDRH